MTRAEQIADTAWRACATTQDGALCLLCTLALATRLAAATPVHARTRRRPRRRERMP